MDDYELLEEIGHGGRSRVYRARQRSTGAHVALRRTPSRAGGVPAAAAERAAVCLSEHQRARALRHSALLPLEACFLDGAYVCAVSPLASGGSLEDAQLAAGGALGGETLTWAAHGAVQALCYLHARDPAPIVHRVRCSRAAGSA